MEKSYAIRPAIWTALETKDFTIWDPYHDDLKRWYIDEGCSLKIVQTKMENKHGFPSTPLDQYEIVLRDHFHFRKNLEQRDWAFIAQHVGERRRNGKDNNVYLDGKLLERKRIQRGIRRYGGKKVKSSHKIQQPHSMQPRILIRTPSPDPARRLRDLGNIASLSVLDKLLFSTRSFLDSSFESAAHSRSRPEDVALYEEQLRKVFSWFNDFVSALSLLEDRKVRPAFRILQQCFDNTSIIVRVQHPFILHSVCRQVLDCMECDTRLAQMLLRHCAALFRVVYGISYPLYTIMDKLSQMDSRELANHVERLIGSCLDILEPFSRGSPAALENLIESRGILINLLEETHMVGFQEARIMLDNLIRKGKDYGTCTVHSKMVKSEVLQRNGYLHEALSLTLEALDSHGASNVDSAHIRVNLLDILRDMGDYDGAIRISYDLVESLRNSSGNGHHGKWFPSMIFLDQKQSILQLVLEELERDLRKSGRIEEAEAIQRRLEDGAHSLI